MYQKGLCKLYRNRGEPDVVVPTAPNYGGIVSSPQWEATDEDLSSWGRYLVRWKGRCSLGLCFESGLCTWANSFISVSLCTVTSCTWVLTLFLAVWLCGRGMGRRKKREKSTTFSILILASTGAQHWKYSCGQSLLQGTWSWTRTPDMGIIRSLDCLGESM